MLFLLTFITFSYQVKTRKSTQDTHRVTNNNIITDRGQNTEIKNNGVKRRETNRETNDAHAPLDEMITLGVAKRPKRKFIPKTCDCHNHEKKIARKNSLLGCDDSSNHNNVFGDQSTEHIQKSTTLQGQKKQKNTNLFSIPSSDRKRANNYLAQHTEKANEVATEVITNAHENRTDAKRTKNQDDVDSNNNNVAQVLYSKKDKNALCDKYFGLHLENEEVNCLSKEIQRLIINNFTDRDIMIDFITDFFEYSNEAFQLEMICLYKWLYDKYSINKTCDTKQETLYFYSIDDIGDVMSYLRKRNLSIYNVKNKVTQIEFYKNNTDFTTSLLFFMNKQAKNRNCSLLIKNERIEESQKQEIIQKMCKIYDSLLEQY
ncbi:hypothetical protein BDAP_002729 [Binucleata daphniae]